MRVGDYPFGVFGTPRDLLGAEELLVAFYDDPGMVRDMMDHLTTLWLHLWEQVARHVQIDQIHIWEDMSGKQGSLISPAMVNEFMMPCYDRIADLAKRCGVRVISVDTDGNCGELVPLMMAHGVNVFMPFEVQAGNDLFDYRRRYPTLGIMGGLDKRALARGRAEIERRGRKGPPDDRARPLHPRLRPPDPAGRSVGKHEVRRGADSRGMHDSRSPLAAVGSLRMYGVAVPGQQGQESMGTWSAFKLIALSAAILVAFACLFRWLRTVGRHAAEPCCCSCGYCVRGLSALLCPECGADLSTVGYYPEGMRVPVSRPIWSAVWVGLWSLALLVPAYLVSLVIADMVCPRAVAVQRRLTVTLEPDRLHASVTMAASGSAVVWGGSREMPIPICVTFSLSVAQSPRLETNVPTGDWRVVDPTGRTLEDGKAFGTHAVERWLTAAGYDVRGFPDSFCASFCDWIPSCTIHSLRLGRFFYEQRSSIKSPAPGPSLIRTRLLWHSDVFLMLPWLAVWWWGRRRILRGYPQTGIKPRTLADMPA